MSGAEKDGKGEIPVPVYTQPSVSPSLYNSTVNQLEAVALQLKIVCPED